jgi:putative SOS response-associated peptidase YedK
MILNYDVATTVAECARALERRKFRAAIMPAALALDVPGNFQPDDNAPVLLRRSNVQIDALRWGWTDKATMKTVYFSSADHSYGHRGILPVSSFLTELEDGDKLYSARVTNAHGGLLPIGVFWRAASALGPKAFSVLLCKAGPDLSQHCDHQPVVIDPGHIARFLDHTQPAQQLQKHAPPGMFSIELVGTQARPDGPRPNPFGMESDPRFFTTAVETPFKKPMLPLLQF